ncbi:MAG: Uma2 family endonuclease [Acidobacteriota bacterium]|jgi:Uma2 family endonuclease
MRRTNIRFNYHDYLQLPEGKRYEILDGELYVVPAPNTRHQRLFREIFDVLLHHTRERELGEVLGAPYDVVLSDENIVQPDILFVSKERLGIIRESNITGPPDLVIEILSPTTRTRDLEIKRKIYAGFGIREYWVVDPESATVEVLTWSEPGYTRAGIYGKSQHLSSPLLPELNLPLDEIFA